MCEIEISPMGRNNENPGLVCEKELSYMGKKQWKSRSGERETTVQYRQGYGRRYKDNNKMFHT